MKTENNSGMLTVFWPIIIIIITTIISNGNWTEWSTVQGVIGRAHSANTIWNYEHDFPWNVQHEIQEPINGIYDKMQDKEIYVPLEDVFVIIIIICNNNNNNSKNNKLGISS